MTPPDARDSAGSHESSAGETTAAGGAASELNNILQIILGTAGMMENIWEGNRGSEKYLEMLRGSVDRAAAVTAQLVAQAGGLDEKVILHPALAAFAARPRKRVEAESICHHIMVVDDEPLALSLAKEILLEARFAVSTAQSGFECLDLFSRRPNEFDLVVLDFTMPFMNGEETFDRLRAMRKDVPVILSTGFVREDILSRMFAAGLSGFLQKPQRASDYVAHVRAVLERVAASRQHNAGGGIASASQTP